MWHEDAAPGNEKRTYRFCNTPSFRFFSYQTSVVTIQRWCINVLSLIMRAGFFLRIWRAGFFLRLWRAGFFLRIWRAGMEVRLS